jgi:hypothetical protein
MLGAVFRTWRITDQSSNTPQVFGTKCRLPKQGSKLDCPNNAAIALGHDCGSRLVRREHGAEGQLICFGHVLHNTANEFYLLDIISETTKQISV